MADERREGPGARYRVRVHFENLLRLAHADRPVEKALATGSVPPELRQLWNRMEAQGVDVRLFDRGSPERGEQEMPDRLLQLRMLEDALDYNGDPGIVVLLTGDGAGYLEAPHSRPGASLTLCAGRASGPRPHRPRMERMQPKTIAPAVVCNAMWMLTDYTPDNGATLLVPGSHLSGRQPDHDLDGDAGWVPAVGPAGTVAIFEGRTWHSTGENRTGEPRIGLTTNFCAPQFRQQENYLLGTRPEVLESASPELLKLIGFKPWQGYGGYENGADWNKRGVYALGELVPEEGTDNG